jgi:hypothetical protein
MRLFSQPALNGENSASRQMFDMIPVRQMENIRSMRNDGSKKRFGWGKKWERRVGCLATDSALKWAGYRTFIRFRDQNLVQQGRVFADKSGGPRNWTVFSSKKQMVWMKWFFIPRALSKLARGYLSSVQKTRHAAFGARKQRARWRCIVIFSRYSASIAPSSECLLLQCVPALAILDNWHRKASPGYNVFCGIQQFKRPSSSLVEKFAFWNSSFSDHHLRQRGNFSVLQASQQYRVGLALGILSIEYFWFCRGIFAKIGGAPVLKPSWGVRWPCELHFQEIGADFVSHERREESEMAVFWA